MSTRKRDKTLTVRLTEKEKNQILLKSKRAKMTVTDYIVTLNSGKEINIIEDLKPMLLELKAYGRNLNQLTVLSHLGKISAVDLSQTTQILQKNYDVLVKLLDKVGGN